MQKQRDNAYLTQLCRGRTQYEISEIQFDLMWFPVVCGFFALCVLYPVFQAILGYMCLTGQDTNEVHSYTQQRYTHKHTHAHTYTRLQGMS